MLCNIACNVLGLGEVPPCRMLKFSTKACGGILPNHCYKPFLFVFGLTLNWNKMYNYQTEKSKIFTEDGQETFLKIRDKVQQLLKQSGAVMMQNAISGVTGDSWLHLACVDRLVELKEIREITKENVSGQHRVFVAVS
jgi:hypothetical protein